MTDSFWSFKL